MSLLAHGAAGLINTWGFAYVGGIVGLFSVSLLYVKGKVVDEQITNERAGRRSKLAALGPGVIAVGGVCGVSFGLGTAGVLDRIVDDHVEVSEIVAELCSRPTELTLKMDDDLHDDIDHAIDDLDATAAGGAHRELHADNLTEPDRTALVDRLVNELSEANGTPVTSCDDLQAGQ